MRVRLVVQGDVDGAAWEFWKDIEASSAPGVGDTVSLGARTGAPAHLNERLVTCIRWAADLTHVEVRLADLDAGWLRANRREFGEASWVAAMAGSG
jgi:hypothetical protein